MKLQEIYDKYVYHRDSVKQIQIWYQDKTFESKIKHFNIQEFFGFDSGWMSHEGREKVKDTTDYPELDDADFEFISDDYEKDYGDGAVSVIAYTILKITIKNDEEPGEPEYLEAIRILKKRLVDLKEEKEDIEHKARAVEAFYRYPSATFTYTDPFRGGLVTTKVSDRYTKYVYGYAVYGISDEIEEAFLTEILADCFSEDGLENKFYERFSEELKSEDKRWCMGTLEDYVDYFDEDTIKNVYECTDRYDDYSDYPSNEEVACDYFDKIKEIFEKEPTEENYKTEKLERCDEYMSYSEAKRYYENCKGSYPYIAFYEKEITGTKENITILETYNFKNEFKKEE